MNGASTFVAASLFCGDDFADEGLEGGWGGGEPQGGAEHLVGFCEEGFVFAEEGDEGLIGFYLFAELDVHLEAGVGADWIAGVEAAGSEALDGPAYFRAVHGTKVAGGFGFEDAGGFGFVEGGGVSIAFHDGDVAAVGLDDFEEGFEGCSRVEDVVGEGCACFGGVGVTGEVEHPTGEDVGEVDEIGGARVAVLLHDVDALPHLDPVAGEAAQGFFHSGEESDCPRTR